MSKYLDIAMTHLLAFTSNLKDFFANCIIISCLSLIQEIWLDKYL